MTKATPLHIVWLRNDLRSFDNAALYHAADAASKEADSVVIAVFIATPTTWQQHHMAPIKQDFTRRRVKQMQLELAEQGIALLALEARQYQDCSAIFGKLCAAGMVALYGQTEYEMREQHRDNMISQQLQEAGVTVNWYDRLCIMPPGTILTHGGDTYKVFTPFKRNWLARLHEQGVHCYPKAKGAVLYDVNRLAKSLGLPAMAHGDDSSEKWPVAEPQVLERMREFCQQRVDDYQRNRDFPAVDGTSGLSAYLACGMLSAQQCVNRLQMEAGTMLEQEKSGASVWLSELIWREFYKHILVAYPELIKHKPFQTDTAAIRWRNNKELYNAWCDGKTGYPIVDAAMRQLNQTGWMHNRLRMITASFLVKDLQIDWRWGEQYFMSKLIDGEFAANNGGWQWAASTGTDAAPYFRIFNPVTQSERFDPDGEFIRRFVPELAKLTNKEIHWPHKKVTPASYWPAVVDHNEARKITLALFTEVKKPMPELTEPKIARFLQFYNALSHDGLEQLADIYTEDVTFIDPVHQINGRGQLITYFSHAYQRLNFCKFEAVSHTDSEKLSFISWIMILSHPAIGKGKEIEVEGCTELRWRGNHIYYHRDFYDLTELVYQHVPLLGWATSKVKQRMAKA